MPSAIEAPPSVASGLQRIGRASHQVGAVSTGIVFPKYRSDLIACAAATRAMHDGHVEATRYPRNPLDILAQQIGSRVGIQDVSLESNSFAQNQTSLVLGRYLSPHIYISYGISLAEAINTIKMRYTIGDRWTIKTEAGKERSADLVFTIEK